mgnify:CR=1 FL=1
MNRRRFLGIVAATALLPRFAWAKPSKALIVVFSRRDNTLALARMIAERTGADIFVLQPAAPYPKDYRANVEQVARENAQGFLPPLARLPENLEAYRTVFLGFPTWAMQLPPPVKSFLKRRIWQTKPSCPSTRTAVTAQERPLPKPRGSPRKVPLKRGSALKARRARRSGLGGAGCICAAGAGAARCMAGGGILTNSPHIFQVAFQAAFPLYVTIHN